MLRHAFLYLAEQPAIKDMALRFSFAEQIAFRFVAAEELENALQVVEGLNERSLLVTLDHLGENVVSLHDARSATETYLGIFDAIDGTDVRANISVKLTQLGLALDKDVAQEHLIQIVARAHQYGNSVEVDMEGSDYTQLTLEIFHCVRHAGYENVGAVVQAYLYRTEADIEQLIPLGGKIRLCKGAYDEPAEIAFQRRADVDANFVRLAQLLFGPEAKANGVVPAIASHDEAMIGAAKEAARQNDWPREDFEFQMLYGVRRNLQADLASAGYSVRVYVPYGTEWYPYFMRRMAERPANVIFVGRALLGQVISND
jgi:proline dehydrogenase